MKLKQNTNSAQKSEPLMKVVRVDGSNCQKYLDGMAEIHKGAYSHDHFSSSFSEAKLREYNECLVRYSDVTLVALSDDQVTGFIISGRGVWKGVREFKENNRIYLLGRLAARPWTALNKVRIALISKIVPQHDSFASYRLLSIATRAGRQSHGIGRTLISALEQELVSCNIPMYGLSVKKDNQRAVRFYERHGFHSEKEAFGSVYFVKKVGKLK